MAIVVIAGFAALIFRWMAYRRESVSLPDACRQALRALPDGLRDKAPLLLWCSVDDEIASVEPSFHAGNAVWVKVREPSQLVLVAEGVRHWRGRDPDGVVFAVTPGQSMDETILLGKAASWRRALQDCASRLRGEMPVWLVLYAPALSEAVSGEPAVWRGVLGNAKARPCDAGVLLDLLAERLNARIGRLPVGAPDRRNAQIAAVVQWARTLLVPVFRDRDAGLAETRFQGVLAGEQGDCPPQSAFAHWMVLRCGVQPARGATIPADALTAKLPFPLVPHLPRRRPAQAPVRALLHIIALTALAITLAMLASANNNEQLLRALEHDLTTYASTPDAQVADKRLALARLVQDRDTLEGHLRSGVPWTLSWWMYRGGLFLPPIEEAIASYRSPQPPPAVVTLDSLSLFASNSSQLKPDANRALVSVLVAIMQHSDKRILIAGHTDSTGNPAANQVLSQARAAAVRDWFVAMSQMPVTRFAIQGYGDTRPLVPNDNAENMARNRRVEITLVPD